MTTTAAIYGVRYRILDTQEELTEWFTTLAARDLALAAARAYRGPNRTYPYGVVRSPVRAQRKAVCVYDRV
jgi:hypothetical protein